MKISKLIYRIAFATAALAIFLNLYLVFSYFNPYTRNGVKAALIMPEFIQKNRYAGWDKVFKFKLLNKWTAKPVVKTLTIATPNGEITADLWLPNDGRKKHGAVIATLGIGVNRTDSRATFLANIIARSGVVVLLPEIPGFMQDRIIPAEADDLVASFNYLALQPFIKAEKIGFLSFCGASTISLIAAENPVIAGEVAYLAVNNLFYKASSLIEAAVAGQLNDSEGKIVPWQMNATTVRVVNRETIESLENDKDKEILIPYLVNQPENVLHSRDFPPIPATESAQLSTNGQKIYQLLVNKDPKLTADLLAQIPESSKYSNDYLTTAIPNIKNLRAPLFVIADRGNTFQPFTDSRKVLAHLPKSQYTYVETDILKDGYLAQDLTFKKGP